MPMAHSSPSEAVTLSLNPDRLGLSMAVKPRDVEIERRRDEALKRALNMPPKPHKSDKGQKQAGDRRQAPSRRKKAK